MKQVAVTGKRKAGIESVPTPVPRDNWALVKVEVAPMCTEFKAFEAGSNPLLLGHEAAGEVVDIAQPGRVKPGDRVVVMPMNSCGSCDLCLAGEIHPLRGTRRTSTRCMARSTARARWRSTCSSRTGCSLPIPDDISTETRGDGLLRLGTQLWRDARRWKSTATTLC